MNRGTALKIVLGLVGVLFLAAAYPMLVFVRQEPALAMMMSLYVTLGVFLLLAIHNPLANRSLIAFTSRKSASIFTTKASTNTAIGVARASVSLAELESGLPA